MTVPLDQYLDEQDRDFEEFERGQEISNRIVLGDGVEYIEQPDGNFINTALEREFPASFVIRLISGGGRGK